MHLVEMSEDATPAQVMVYRWDSLLMLMTLRKVFIQYWDYSALVCLYALFLLLK